MAWTLLLTDIVDSTKKVRELGDARAAELFARHDRLARDLLPPHRGREIDKTDGFLMIFEDASDALAYALAYHGGMRTLSEEFGLPVLARAGLHTAEVVLRENPASDVALGAKPLEVDGIAKPTAARIMSLALGGQTLLSESTRAAATAPPGSPSVSHGHYRVKGLDEPIELFEVGQAEHAPLRPPPDSEKVRRVVQTGFGWTLLHDLPNNLPVPSTRFFGRTTELRQLADRVDGAVLVSVVGLGGLGKSRLVQNYARTFLGDFAGGGWWCGVEGCMTEEDICRSVAAALEVPLTSADPVVRLGDALAARGRALVVLDGLLREELAAGTLGRWMQMAPQIRFVLTTLSPTGLSDEVTLVLGPLGLAQASELFVDRARLVKPDFSAPREQIESLVNELDRLPLAIELAAGRVRVMSVSTIRQRLSRRFDLLKGGNRTTLRGVLDVSWEHLSKQEQVALAQCTVFQGGWSLEAAEAVLELPDDGWPVDVLEGLALKGLIRTFEHDGEVRFGLLRSIREYAAERLADEGVRDRHAAFYADAELQVVELDNQLAAVGHAMDIGQPALALRGAVPAANLMRRIGPLNRASELVASVLDLELSPNQRARMLHERARLLANSDLDAAEAAVDEALQLVSGDAVLHAMLLATRANIDLQRGRTAVAEPTFRHALKLLGDDPMSGAVHGNLALLHMRLGRADQAITSYEQAIRAHQRAGNRRSLGVALGNLGVIHRRQGQDSKARVLLQQALEVHLEVGDVAHEAAVLGSLALMELHAGELDQARARLERAVALQRQLGNQRGEGIALGNLGSVHLGAGELDIARERLSRAVEVVRTAGVPRAEGAFLGTLAEVERQSGDPAAARRFLHRAEGLLRRAQDKVELAKVLCRRGHLDLDEGLTKAARLADAEARELVPRATDTSEIGRLMTALERRLG